MNVIDRLKEKIDEANIWGKSISLQRAELVKNGGTKDTNIYYVESGCLRIFIEDENEEHTIRFGYQGDFIAALDSFITDQSSPMCIEALKKTKCRVIDKGAYINFMHSDPECKLLWEQLLQGLLVQQIERETDLLTSSPKSRYERVLKRSPRLFQEVPNKYIANYLRMTPETFSRIQKS